MSVRAIAVRNAPRVMSPAVTGHGARPARSRPRRRSPVRPHRRGVWQELADDRQLIGVKMILLGLLVLAMMALEVPL